MPPDLDLANSVPIAETSVCRIYNRENIDTNVLNFRYSNQFAEGYCTLGENGAMNILHTCRPKSVKLLICNLLHIIRRRGNYEALYTSTGIE